MYDYGLFQFSAPLYSGSDWFQSACGIIGLRNSPVINVGTNHFDDSKHQLKVASVIHPCNWIHRCYYEKTQFAGLDHSSFDDFVREFLVRFSGGVSAIFRLFEADTFLRVEDQPHAFLELMEVLGIPKSLRDRLLDHPIAPTLVTYHQWDHALRKQFMESERDMCERYDYF